MTWPRLMGLLLAASALFWLLSAPAQAQWKWRDASGRVTISDLPPPRDVADKDILQRPQSAQRASTPASAAASAATATAGPAAPVAPAAPPAAAASGPASKTGLEAEVEKRRRTAEAEAQAKAKADEDKLAAQRRENCSRARQHLATIDSGMRVVRVNAKGEREVLDDSQRAEEARRAREVIASDCR